MARQPRIHLPGAVYHVMLRGKGGQDIFFENDDYTYLYGLLEEGIRRFGYRVHGFCCMRNRKGAVAFLKSLLYTPTA
jgi:REP element-mobilizing transposase RayT